MCKVLTVAGGCFGARSHGGGYQCAIPLPHPARLPLLLLLLLLLLKE